MPTSNLTHDHAAKIGEYLISKDHGEFEHIDHVLEKYARETGIELPPVRGMEIDHIYWAADIFRCGYCCQWFSRTERSRKAEKYTSDAYCQLCFGAIGDDLIAVAQILDATAAADGDFIPTEAAS